MNIALQILAMIGISVLGSLLFTVIRAKKYFRPDVFSWKVFFKENKFTWMYSIMVCTLIAVIVTVLPGSAESIKTATGLSVAEELASFLTLGYALCASMKKKKDPEERV